MALDAVVTIDGSGVITAWNAQAANIFGWSKEEAVGRSLAETIIPEQHREAHNRGLGHAVATGEGPVIGKRIELTALRADGTEFTATVRIDTPNEWQYYRHGGILPYVLRQLAAGGASASK